jgi:hypothetical protein
MTRERFIKNSFRLLLATVLGLIALLLGRKAEAGRGCNDCISSGTCSGTEICEQFKKRS